jgi:hypothetical protein
VTPKYRENDLNFRKHFFMCKPGYPRILKLSFCKEIDFPRPALREEPIARPSPEIQSGTPFLK